MEFKYALEVGIKVEFKEDKNGEFYAMWNSGKCVEYITEEEFYQYNKKEIIEKVEIKEQNLSNKSDKNKIENNLDLLNGLAEKYGVGAVLRMQHFIGNKRLGKVVDYKLSLGNKGDLIGEVIGTEGYVILRQYVYWTPNGHQAFRMKVLQG